MTAESPHPNFLNPNILYHDYGVKNREVTQASPVDVNWCVEQAEEIAKKTGIPEIDVLHGLLAVSSIGFFFESMDPYIQKSLFCWYLSQKLLGKNVENYTTIASAVNEYAYFGNRLSDSHEVFYTPYWKDDTPIIHNEKVVTDAIANIESSVYQEVQILFRLMTADLPVHRIDKFDNMNKFEILKELILTSIRQGCPLKEKLKLNEKAKKIDDFDKDCAYAIYFYQALIMLLHPKIRKVTSEKSIEEMKLFLYKFGFNDSDLDTIIKFSERIVKTQKLVRIQKEKKDSNILRWRKILDKINLTSDQLSEKDISHILKEAPERIERGLFNSRRSEFLTISEVLYLLKYTNTIKSRTGAVKFLVHKMTQYGVTDVRLFVSDSSNVIHIRQLSSFIKILDKHPEFIHPSIQKKHEH